MFLLFMNVTNFPYLLVNTTIWPWKTRKYVKKVNFYRQLRQVCLTKHSICLHILSYIFLYMRAQTSIASLVTSLALIAEPVSAADKTCGQTRAAYDVIMNPHISLIETDLTSYKLPFWDCASYWLEFSSPPKLSLRPLILPQSPSIFPLEQQTSNRVADIFAESSVHLYKQRGKQSLGLWLEQGKLGWRFVQKHRWITSIFELRTNIRNTQLTAQFIY